MLMVYLPIKARKSLQNLLETVLLGSGYLDTVSLYK